MLSPGRRRHRRRREGRPARDRRRAHDDAPPSRPLAFIEGPHGQQFLGVMPKVVICALGRLPRRGLPDPARPPRAHARKRAPSEPGPIGGPSCARFGERAPQVSSRTGCRASSRSKLRFLLRWRYATAAVGARHASHWSSGLVAGGVIPFVFLPAGRRRDGHRRSWRWPRARPKRSRRTPWPAIERARARRRPRSRSPSSPCSAPPSATGAGDSAVRSRRRRPGDDRAAGGRRCARPRACAPPSDVLTELRERDGRPARRAAALLIAQAGGPQAARTSRSACAATTSTAPEGAVAHVACIVERSSSTASRRCTTTSSSASSRRACALREDARLLGLTTSDVALQLRHALFGFEVQDLQIGDDEVTVRVMLPESERRSLDDLGRLRIGLPGGGPRAAQRGGDVRHRARLRFVARVDGKRAAPSPPQVDEHHDGQRLGR